MPQANSNNISIYYEVHGDHGSPLIMINGYGGNIAGWLPEQIQMLSEHHQVILFDNRGAGQSDKPTTPYSMAQFAADTVAVLDALHLDRGHVFGLSMGGMIAQHVALNYPTRVLGLILDVTAVAWMGHPKFVAPSQEVFAQLTKPPSGDRAKDTREGWELFYTPAFIESNQELLEHNLQRQLTLPQTPAFSLKLQNEAMLKTHDTYEQLPQIACPTLIQTGTEDLVIPAVNSQMMASLIPNARLIEYPGCGHLLMKACGTEVLQDILDFLEEVDRAMLGD